jgi:hypothetical protein
MLRARCDKCLNRTGRGNDCRSVWIALRHAQVPQRQRCQDAVDHEALRTCWQRAADRLGLSVLARARVGLNRRPGVIGGRFYAQAEASSIAASVLMRPYDALHSCSQLSNARVLIASSTI